MKRGDVEMFTAPRVALLRSIMLNHWYHHRGQLTVYLRAARRAGAVDLRTQRRRESVRLTRSATWPLGDARGAGSARPTSARLSRRRPRLRPWCRASARSAVELHRLVGIGAQSVNVRTWPGFSPARAACRRGRRHEPQLRQSPRTCPREPSTWPARVGTACRRAAVRRRAAAAFSLARAAPPREAQSPATPDESGFSRPSQSMHRMSASAPITARLVALRWPFCMRAAHATECASINQLDSRPVAPPDSVNDHGVGSRGGRGHTGRTRPPAAVPDLRPRRRLRRDVRRARARSRAHYAALFERLQVTRPAGDAPAAVGRRPRLPAPGHHVHGLRPGRRHRAHLPLRPDPAHHHRRRMGRARARPDAADHRAQPVPEGHLHRRARPRRRHRPARAGLQLQALPPRDAGRARRGTTSTCRWPAPTWCACPTARLPCSRTTCACRAA